MKANTKVGIHFENDDTCMVCVYGVVGNQNLSRLEKAGKLTYITFDELALGDTYCNHCGCDLSDPENQPRGI